MTEEKKHNGWLSKIVILFVLIGGVWGGWTAIGSDTDRKILASEKKQSIEVAQTLQEFRHGQTMKNKEQDLRYWQSHKEIAIVNVRNICILLQQKPNDGRLLQDKATWENEIRKADQMLLQLMNSP